MRYSADCATVFYLKLIILKLIEASVVDNQAGRVICIYWHWKPVMLRLLFCAIVTGVLGGGLCQLDTSSGPIPVNKNLWLVDFISNGKLTL